MTSFWATIDSKCRDDPDAPECAEEKDYNDLRTPADYGTENQTYIIDGSGVYVTRNENYEYGRFEMSYNRAYGNGINGLVVHKTDRARSGVRHNVHEKCIQ